MNKIELTKLYWDKKLSLSEIAKLKGTSVTSVFRIFKKLGIQTDHIRRKSGNKSNLWKGGIIRSHIYIKLKSSHENATKQGYIPEHRLKIIQKIGRPLKENEVVHHINGNKRDNRLKNLLLLTDSEHKKLHASMRNRDDNNRFSLSYGR